MKKDIIILTKSDKHSGFCVAGIDMFNGEWVRLVSGNAATEHAVPVEDMICDNGQIIDIYDIIEIDIYKHVPTNVQPENYLYNESIKWKKKGKSNLSQVISLHGYDYPEYVFGNTYRRLDDGNIGLAGASLLLLKVDNPRYVVKSFPERKLIQLNFFYRDNSYAFFNVTQKDLKEYFNNQPDNSYISNANVFVFSLTEKYIDEKYYKVVAQELT